MKKTTFGVGHGGLANEKVVGFFPLLCSFKSTGQFQHRAKFVVREYFVVVGVCGFEHGFDFFIG